MATTTERLVRSREFLQTVLPAASQHAFNRNTRKTPTQSSDAALGALRGGVNRQSKVPQLHVTVLHEEDVLRSLDGKIERMYEQGRE